MSHWKKFESNVLENTKRELLTTALAEMGVELDTNIRSIRNTWGHETVDAGFKKNGSAIALGINFKRTADGTEKVELTGDFYGTGLSEQGFIDRLAQVYQKHNVVQKCEEQGWIVEDVKTLANGEIYVEAYQWS